jgi:hypothetical protein
MVDLTATQAQAKGASPSINGKEGYNKAAAAKPLNVLSPPPAEEVDKLYCQLAEINAIIPAQLAECAHWCRSDPTSGMI